MTRKEAIDILTSATVWNDKERTALATLIPELRESEEEQALRIIRKRMCHNPAPISDEDRRIVENWLEKQKEQNIPSEEPKCSQFVYDDKLALEDAMYIVERRGEEALHKALKSLYSRIDDVMDMQKEQKPAEWSAKINGEPIPTENQSVDISVPGWSEEDKNKLNHILEIVHIASGSDVSVDEKEELESFLKSLRPQSKDEIYKEKDEAFKLGKHQLAIRFMNYLDENRPEGKMGLSNSECEDIDKAFKENDWAKIMRYVEKYSPSWKPSEEQIYSLGTVVKGYNECAVGSVGYHLKEMYEQLKKLM